jgi:hypothetical protein
MKEGRLITQGRKEERTILEWNIDTIIYNQHQGKEGSTMKEET